MNDQIRPWLDRRAVEKHALPLTDGAGKRVWCPPGWKLVPEEPTIEMVDAAFVWNLDREKVRAAIQAAPEPDISDAR